MKTVKLMLTIVGVALRYTYRVSGDVIPKWKYVYFFFYQRILMFNVHVPWPCHPTATVNNVKRIKWGLGSMPGTGPGQYIQGGNGIILCDNVSKVFSYTRSLNSPFLEPRPEGISVIVCYLCAC